MRIGWERLSTSAAAACIAFSLRPTSLLNPRPDMNAACILYAVLTIAKLSNLSRVMRICLQMYDRLPGGEGGNSISLLHPLWPQQSGGCVASMMAPCYAVTPPDTSSAGQYNETWGHIMKKKKKSFFSLLFCSQLAQIRYRLPTWFILQVVTSVVKEKREERRGPIDGWTASGGGGQWWGGGRRIVAFRLPEYIQTFIGVTRSLLHAFMSCLNVVAWETPRQGKMQGSRRESWYWWRVKGWRGWQEREKRQKWGLSGGVKKKSEPGVLSQHPPPPNQQRA